MFGHIFHDFLDCDIGSVFNYALVNVSNYALNHPELLEQLPPSVKHLLREHILLSIHPQIREAFLS
jgi:hypothetical protein